MFWENQSELKGLNMWHYEQNYINHININAEHRHPYNESKQNYVYYSRTSLQMEKKTQVAVWAVIVC